MNQNACDSGCNDYSLLIARMGLAQVAFANPNLDGSGAVTSVITGAENGTVIKSIIIKSIQPTLTGMVRLFIKKPAATGILYREIPISTNPSLSDTPTPAPILPMIEIDLVEGLKLEAGTALLASTQNTETFNVFAFGYDYEYPASLPDTCCNFKQTRVVTGNGVVSVADTSLDGSGIIEPVFTAPAPATSNGTVVRSITIAALQSTHEGMIRFFIDNPGPARPELLMEVHVPETIQSDYEPSFKQVINDEFILPAGAVMYASTDQPESFAITVTGESWSYPIS